MDQLTPSVHNIGPYRAIDYEFAITCSDAALAAHLDEIFFYLRSSSTTQPTEITLDVRDTSGRLMAGQDDRELPLHKLVPSVVSHVNFYAAKTRKDADFPVLHAGAVQGDRGIIVLPGRSGSGKSTLAAALVGAGFDYVADELVAVRASDRVEGYPKAITLKDGSWDAVDVQRPDRGELSRFISGVDYVRHEHFAPSEPVLSGVPSTIVFPTYTGQGEASVVHLSPAEALVQLIECAYLPLTSDSFRILADLAASASAIRLAHTSTEHALAEVGNFLEAKTAATSTDAGLTVSASAPTGSSRVHPTTIAAEFEDELVLVNTDTNAVVHLNADGAEQWRSIVAGDMETSDMTRELTRLKFLM